VPVKAKGLIIGKGGETIKSIMAKTRTKIASSRDRSDSTFTITGSSSEAINAAKSEIDVLVASFHKSKKAPPRDANNNYQASCGGKLPKNWVNCPVTGQTLIDDFLLPVKCPLHDNFTAKVKQAGESLWRLEELFQLAHDKFDKKIGLIKGVYILYLFLKVPSKLDNSFCAFSYFPNEHKRPKHRFDRYKSLL